MIYKDNEETFLYENKKNKDKKLSKRALVDQIVIGQIN